MKQSMTINIFFTFKTNICRKGAVLVLSQTEIMNAQVKYSVVRAAQAVPEMFS